jgi:Na+/H+ antiporter NhaD/arsenite permease-like protein
MSGNDAGEKKSCHPVSIVAMMFGATLGGNATLIGASANIISGGICAAHGKPIRFTTFVRYGVPVTLAQMAVAALYVVALYFLVY